MIGTVRDTAIYSYHIDDVLGKLGRYKTSDKPQNRFPPRAEKNKTPFDNEAFFKVLFSFDGDTMAISKVGMAEIQKQQTFENEPSKPTDTKKMETLDNQKNNDSQTSLPNLEGLSRFELDRLVSENKIPLASYLYELKRRETQQKDQQH